MELVFPRIMAVVTVHSFTTPKGFENIWQISDSKEWRIRPTVQIEHRMPFVSLGRWKMREDFSRQRLDRHGDLSVAVGRFLSRPSVCILQFLWSFRKRYSDYRCAMGATENPSMEYHKMTKRLSQ
jgi:hypothetical protein